MWLALARKGKKGKLCPYFAVSESIKNCFLHHKRPTEIDDDAFDRLYGHISHPIEIKNKGQKIAVRIVSQFGEECTKVMGV